MLEACIYFRSGARENCRGWDAWFLGTGKYHKGTPGNNECVSGDDNDDDDDDDDDDDNALSNVYSLVSAMQTVQEKFAANFVFASSHCERSRRPSSSSYISILLKY